MKRSGGGTGWLVLLAIVFVSFVVFAVLLGPSRAVRIAAASFLTSTVDGFAEDLPPHRLRVVEVWIDQEHLDALNSDLPWSGGVNKPAELVENGVHYPVKFRYPGIYAASRAWIAVRDACPMGREHRYSEAQLAFHYRGMRP